MWPFIVSCTIALFVMSLYRFRVIPKLEYTPIVLSIGFCLPAFGAESVIELTQMLALTLLTYFVLASINLASQKEESLKDSLMFSFFFTMQGAFFSSLTGCLIYWVRGLSQIL